MKTIKKHPTYAGQLSHVKFNASDQSLELNCARNIPEQDIQSYLQYVCNLTKVVPIKTLLINDDTAERNPLRLVWKIIEASWESICKNGGKKIVVIHNANLPNYVKEIYVNTMKSFGIPIQLEFKSIRHASLGVQRTNET